MYETPSTSIIMTVTRFEIIQSRRDRILWDLYAFYYVCKSGKLIKCRSNFCSAISHNHDVRLTPDRHVNQTANWQPDYAPWTTDSNNLLFSHEDIRTKFEVKSIIFTWECLKYKTRWLFNNHLMFSNCSEKFHSSKFFF